MIRFRKQFKWIVALCGLSLLAAWPLYSIERRHDLDVALIAAIRIHDTRSVVSLLNQGADPNAQGALRKQDLDLPLLQRLYDRITGRGPRPIIRTALHLALGNPLNNANETIPPENAALIKALLDRGADPNFPNEDGLPPLLSAASLGEYEIATLLLDRGVDVESKDPEGRTALMMAAYEGDCKMLTLLIQHGARIDTRQRDGYTARDNAIHFRHPEAAALLKNAGAGKP